MSEVETRLRARPFRVGYPGADETNRLEIEMRYSLNVAEITDTRVMHYCRIEFGHVSHDEAILKSREIATLLSGQGRFFKFELTCWEETGRSVAF